jgi:hypothetical protein
MNSLHVLALFTVMMAWLTRSLFWWGLVAMLMALSSWLG